MGLLDGGAQALFGEVMGPLYLPAVVRDKAVAGSNNKGELTRAAPTTRDCRAMVNKATESMRRDPEYTATDRAVYVLAATLEGDLTSDAEVQVTTGPYAGTWWRCTAPIDRDPAGAYWRTRGVLGKAA